MRIRIILINLMFLIMLTHCANYDFSRRTIQQGNLLPQSKVEQLKIGMSKEDAAILMGTSLMSPLFNNNRWDYAYTSRKGNTDMMKRHLTIYFANNRITRIDQQP